LEGTSTVTVAKEVIEATVLKEKVAASMQKFITGSVIFCPG
jgi:hypothetical protein